MLRKLLSILGVYKFYEKWLWYQLKNGGKPEHIAIILDGNRRWAYRKTVNPWVGHKEGAEKIKTLLDWCLDLNVDSITLYTFSIENFNRSNREVNEIMRITKEKLGEMLVDERIHKHKIRVKCIGRTKLLPKDLRHLINKIEEETKMYDKRFLNLALAYGGRAEIVDAARKIAHEVEKGMLSPASINEDLFEKYLYTSHMSKQEPDLIVRTSGEERLSGFLLWQSAYSELCFLDVYWPDFRLIDLLRAVRTFQRRKRRFGK